jgi:lysozyme family protein
VKNLLIITLLFFSIICKGGDFELSFVHTIKVEGATFTVSKHDKGGPTKYGIILATYKFWCQNDMFLRCDKDKNGKITKNDLRLTTLSDVKPIYKKYFWDSVKADSIKNQAIAELFYDFVVNSGCGRKNSNIKAMQKIVGVVADGKIGRITLKAINEYPPEKLYKKIYKHRVNYYYSIAIGSQKYNLNGWLNRLIKLKSIHQNYQMK